MNHSQRAAIPGSRYGDTSAAVTLEPTDSTARGVQLWLTLYAYESPMITIPSETARALAADLLQRADLLDGVQR